jgi:p-hydroxybenzoate 3-monooxygenase
VHGGIELLFGGQRHRIDLHGLTGGKNVMVYGQTELTRDLMDARAAAGLPRSTRPKRAVHDFDGASPRHLREGRPDHEHRLRLHRRLRRLSRRVPRQRAAPARSREFEKVYPFGWLGLLADTPPVSTS